MGIEKVINPSDRFGDAAAKCLLVLSTAFKNDQEVLTLLSNVIDPQAENIMRIAHNVSKELIPTVSLKSSVLSPYWAYILKTMRDGFPNGEADDNVFFYTFLMIVDAIAGDEKYKNESIPINNECLSDYTIYAAPSSVLSECFESSIVNPTLLYKFEHLTILNRNRLSPMPDIRFIAMKSFQNTKEKELRIAVVPKIGSFGKYCSFKDCKQDRRFVVVYEDREEEMKRILSIVLEDILQKKPHIIVFSEYSFSPFMLRCVEEYLRNIDNERKNDLAFILAGSTWLTENNTTNNVCHMITSNGYIVDMEYKYVPFTNNALRRKMPRKISEEDKSLTKKEEDKYPLEALDNPGKKVTFIKVPSLGYVQIAICKDAIEPDRFIEAYSTAVRPHLLLVPAYSGRVAPFKPYLEKIRNNYQTISIVVNNCAAAAEDYKNRKSGFICYPPQALMCNPCQKCRNEKKRERKPKDEKGETLCSTCTKNCGCCFLYKIRFYPEAEQSDQRIQVELEHFIQRY